MSLRSRLCLTLVAVTALPAFATVVMALTIEELTQRTPVIVHGSVQRTVTNWTVDHRGIWTWTEISVREALKGEVKATVLVKQPGGKMGALTQSVSGAATFEAGEEVLLFLEPAVDEPGAFVLMGLSAGKVKFESPMGSRLATRNLSGISFAHAGKKGLAGPVAEREILGTADAFLARVRAAVKGAQR